MCIWKIYIGLLHWSTSFHCCYRNINHWRKCKFSLCCYLVIEINAVFFCPKHSTVADLFSVLCPLCMLSFWPWRVRLHIGCTFSYNSSKITSVLFELWNGTANIHFQSWCTMKIGPEWKNKCAARQRNERYSSDTDNSLNVKHVRLTFKWWIKSRLPFARHY